MNRVEKAGYGFALTRAGIMLINKYRNNLAVLFSNSYTLKDSRDDAWYNKLCRRQHTQRCFLQF